MYEINEEEAKKYGTPTKRKDTIKNLRDSIEEVIQLHNITEHLLPSFLKYSEKMSFKMETSYKKGNKKKIQSIHLSAELKKDEQLEPCQKKSQYNDEENMSYDTMRRLQHEIGRLHIP